LPANIKKAAVIGYPVAHSLSPRLHNYWLKKYNIAGEYTAIEVLPENLSEFIKSLDKNGFCGVNVTIPHKENVINLMYEAETLAWRVGAVNMITVKDGRLFGYNTDSYGFVENIMLNITGKNKAIVLGAGGAAKAVVYALYNIGFQRIIIANRTKDKAEKLSDNWHYNGIEVADWENRSEILQDADLLVNTTSLGMTGKGDLEINLEKLPKTALVTDIVYNPLITPLLAQAKARGNPIVDGLGMLLHQAVPAFEAWFGVRPVVDEELRKYILEK